MRFTVQTRPLLAPQVGGASGAVLAWDLRWQRQPLVLAAPHAHAPTTRGAPPSMAVESGVRQVRFDRLAQYSTAALGAGEQGALPPIMLSTEDGQLALAGAGGGCAGLRKAGACIFSEFDTTIGDL